MAWIPEGGERLKAIVGLLDESRCGSAEGVLNGIKRRIGVTRKG